MRTRTPSASISFTGGATGCQRPAFQASRTPPICVSVWRPWHEPACARPA
jgi:hypothetical protein